MNKPKKPNKFSLARKNAGVNLIKHEELVMRRFMTYLRSSDHDKIPAIENLIFILKELRELFKKYRDLKAAEENEEIYR